MTYCRGRLSRNKETFVATRGGKIGPTLWASPVHQELGSGWAIKLLTRKKPCQNFPGPIWSDPVWLDPAQPTRIFSPSKGYLARPARFLGRAGLLKFRPKKSGPILARPCFGPAHCWPGPTRPIASSSRDIVTTKKQNIVAT